MLVPWQFLNRAFYTFLFYFGWIVCLQEASRGQSLYSLLTIGAMIAYYLYCSSCRKADYFLLFLVISLGPMTDIFYSRIGLLHYHHSVYPPLWVFLLWGLFGINIHLFSWMKRYWILAVILGALGGPLSYLSAIELGSVKLLKPLPLAFITIGGIWAIFLPGFIWLEDFLKKRFRKSS